MEGNPVQSVFVPITKEINKLPCLNYLEIISKKLTNYQMYKAYQKVSEKGVYQTRSFLAVKKSCDANTKVLYVGKVQKGLDGRQVVHLGLYKTGATGGLQLALWAKEIGLKLRLHVFVAENPLLAHSIVPLENRLASELKPFIGKYK